MDKTDVHCSFWGKDNGDVRKLIAGGVPKLPATGRVLPAVSICDECVAICAEECSGGMTEIEGELHRALERLVSVVIDVPPFGKREFRRCNLRCQAVTRFRLWRSPRLFLGRMSGMTLSTLGDR